MGTRPEATLIYGILLGNEYDEGHVLRNLAIAEGLDLGVEYSEYADQYVYTETAALYDIGRSGSWGEYSLVVAPKGALFHTDWDTDKRLSVKDLQPKPEWSDRLNKIAQVFGVEDTPEWYLMASYG